MTKKEFMKELERRLSKIPENEKVEALNYYEDYFAEAMIDEDMLVPETMGTPEDIAKQIVEEIVYMEHSESYFDENADMKSDGNEYVPYYRRGEQNSYYSKNDNCYNSKNSQTAGAKTKNNDAKIVAIILLLISFPFWIGFVIAAAACLFVAVVTLGALVFGFGVAGISLVIAAFLASSFAGGMLLAGTGLLLTALALILIIPLVLFCVKFLPWLIQSIARGCKKLFGYGKEQA